MTAGAHLEVLDLSDNASGPIGVDGIQDLLASEVCWGLKELRMANMGLGITGAKVKTIMNTSICSNMSLKLCEGFHGVLMCCRNSLLLFRNVMTVQKLLESLLA